MRGKIAGNELFLERHGSGSPFLGGGDDDLV